MIGADVTGAERRQRIGVIRAKMTVEQVTGAEMTVAEMTAAEMTGAKMTVGEMSGAKMTDEEVPEMPEKCREQR